jgi:hypothetical protein
MSYFVVVPGALVPASIAPPLLARANLPLLRPRLARARPEPPQPFAGDGAAHLDWLWLQFGGTAGSPVTAPYGWHALMQAEHGDAHAEKTLWQADPVHFAFARDHMLVTALDEEATVTDAESRALATEAAATAAEFGATLSAIDSRHWFLSFDPPWSIKTVAFDAALGRSVQQILPEGAAAARWRKLLNEIQMRWHQHPVNERRESEGLRMINGVWLHGGGTWHALPNKPFDVVATSDATIRGWALASGLARNALLDDETKPAGGRTALVYWPHFHAKASNADWDGWLEVLARFDLSLESHVKQAFAGGFGELALVLAGRDMVRKIVLRPSDRVKFWRRSAIAGLFAEPEAA